MLYSNRDAEQFLCSAPDSVKERIVTLFVQENKSPGQIVEILEEEGIMVLPTSLQPLTKAGVLRRVVHQLVDNALRISIQNQRYASHLQSVSGRADERRNEWMREHGMHVWSVEEDHYFEFLLQDPSMRRTPERLNHAKIAEAMRIHFQSTYFTQKNCSDHYLYTRHRERALEKQRERRMLRRSNNRHSCAE